MISITCQHALRAIVHMAAEREDRFFPTRDLAKKSGTSFFFLSKIMYRLNKKGLVRSRRGARGGVILARPASEITLLDVVEAVDGPGFKSKCFLGQNVCSRMTTCAVHSLWEHVRDTYIKMLAGTTLGALAEEQKRNILKNT